MNGVILKDNIGKAVTASANAITRGVRWIDGLKWQVKAVMVLVLFAAVIFVTGPLHFMLRDRGQLMEESLERGKTLTRLLAASNEEAFSQEQEVLFSTEALHGQAGVEEAFVTDAEGVVLAPVEFFGKPLGKIKGYDQRLTKDAGSGLKMYAAGGGTYLLSYPIMNAVETYRGIQQVKKGVAIVRFDPRDSLGRIYYLSVELAKYILILALCAWVGYLALKRWTLMPIRQAVARLQGVRGAEHDSSIAFHEIDELVEMKSSGERKDEAPKKTSGSIWEQLAALDLGNFLVLDEKKTVVAVKGDFTKALGCEVVQGRHMLESMAHSPHLSHISQLIVECEKSTGICTHKVPKGSGFKAVRLTSEQGEAYYVLSVK